MTGGIENVRFSTYAQTLMGKLSNIKWVRTCGYFGELPVQVIALQVPMNVSLKPTHGSGPGAEFSHSIVLRGGVNLTIQRLNCLFRKHH